MAHSALRSALSITRLLTGLPSSLRREVLQAVEGELRQRAEYSSHVGTQPPPPRLPERLRVLIIRAARMMEGKEKLYLKKLFFKDKIHFF